MSTKQKEASKKASKKIAKLREEKIQQDFGKAVAPVMEKKGVKGEIAAMQFEEAISPKNIGKAEKLAKKTFKKGDMSSIKKIADAAADDGPEPADARGAAAEGAREAARLGRDRRRRAPSARVVPALRL